MSHHNKEFPRQAELTQSLKDHGLNHKSPSQLADAFRFGWRAALALATPAPAQPEPKGTTLDEKSPAKGTTSDQSHQPEGKKTGWPPGMLQDDDRKLSLALAGAPHARANADEAAAAIKEMERIRFAAPTSPTPTNSQPATTERPA